MENQKVLYHDDDDDDGDDDDDDDDDYGDNDMALHCKFAKRPLRSKVGKCIE